MAAKIGISEKNLKASADILKIVLADEFVLYTKTRNYHWNVESASFMELHKLFEGQYEALDEIVDSVAERIRTLGHYSLGTLKEFLATTRLTEKGDATTAKKMIANLLADHEDIATFLRKAIDETGNKYGDAGTSDFLTGLLKEHEKTAWFLRSYLK
ncbi:MAG TPA: DNA starvation/stationary phase protection protein [Chitinophagales bacterium]